MAVELGVHLGYHKSSLYSCNASKQRGFGMFVSMVGESAGLSSLFIPPSTVLVAACSPTPSCISRLLDTSSYIEVETNQRSAINA